MSHHLSRRAVLGTGGATMIGSALGGFRASDAVAEAATLRVTHFGGPYQVLSEVIAAPFEAATGTKVVYDVEISPSAFAKIQTQKAEPPFDVVMISRSWALRAQKTGLLLKVSASDFSQADKLLPEIIPAGGWGVATMLDTVDLMVDTRQIKQPVTSWLDLWRDDMKGKIMLPSATNGATAVGFLTCLVRALGGDVKSDAAVNEAFARLKALKPAVRSFYADGNQPNMLIETGDIGVAPQFAIRIANTARKVAGIVKASPKEGVLAAPYDLCIPVNSKNVAAAKSYIDFTLKSSVQEGMVKSLLATPVRRDVSVPADIASLVNVDPAKLIFPDEEFLALKQREWLDRYTRDVQS